MATFEWSRKPARPELSQSAPVFRLKAGGSITAIVLSHDVTGAYLHFFKGTSTPHLEPSSECAACEAERPMRWEGYVAAFIPSTLATVILPITASCQPTFEQWKTSNGSLRGAQLKLVRQGLKPNGRVKAELSKASYPTNSLPPDLEVKAILAHMWKLDAADHPVNRGEHHMNGNGKGKVSA